MWVPSDLESDSENEVEEGAKRKKTEDEEDSGGEFSSEGLVLFYFFRCVTICTRTFPSLKGLSTCGVRQTLTVDLQTGRQTR